MNGAAECGVFQDWNWQNTSPSQRVVTTIQHAHRIIANDGDVVLAGGNVTIQKHYHQADGPEYQTKIAFALRRVRNMRKTHLLILSKATPGTVKWLFTTDKFLLWVDLNGNVKILWGTGIPGAGKSVMASVVINELEAQAAAAAGSICVAYIYFRFNDSTDLSVGSVLEILVKQTVERHPICAQLAERAYERHLREETQPTETELVQLLHEFTDAVSATFYILDALDEAPPHVQLHLVKKLASLNVRLFITSRPMKALEEVVPNVHSFSIVTQEQDLDLHIALKVDCSPSLEALLQRAGATLRDDMVSSIKSNCGGMFLHASLQLDALCQCMSVHDVKLVLSEFPSAIEDVYLQTWNRICFQTPMQTLLVKMVLLWVLNAPIPMTVDGLQLAVIASPGTGRLDHDRIVPTTTLIALCRGLVTYEEKSGFVGLVHYTARGPMQRIVQESFPHPHSYLAAVCIAHLVRCNFPNTPLESEEDFIEALHADPFLAYAAEAWATHARASLDAPDGFQQASKFIIDNHSFPAFTSPDRTEGFDVLSPIHLIAIYDLPLSLLGNKIDNPNVSTKIYQASALTLASWHGNYSLAQELLHLPQTLVNFTNENGWSALMLAARYGHKDIVRLLLWQPEIQVNLTSHDEGWSALMMAARYGRIGIAKLLLAHPDIEVNQVDKDRWSALMLAVRYGPDKIVALLLEQPHTEVNLVDNLGWSALMWAAVYGYKSLVTLLIAYPGIQVNLVNQEGWSALMLAVRNGHEATVCLLLAFPGIEVNSANDEGWSPLHMAAKYGYEGIVSLLLSCPGIDVNLVDTEGWSALMKAAQYRQSGIVSLLLGHAGIDVNVVDTDGWSAFMLACFSGDKDSVQILLTVDDTRVNSVNTYGDTAIKLAAECGHENIVELLLDVPHINASIKSTGDGHTALTIALEKGYTTIVHLLEGGVGEGSPPLMEMMDVEDWMDWLNEETSD